MNCKPGDLAIVLRPTSGGTCNWTGLLVEVVEPLKDIHVYPDIGLVKHKYEANISEWLCRIVSDQKDLLDTTDGHIHLTSYGRMWDHRLLPIRPDESAEESIEVMRLLTHIPSEVTT